MSIFDKDHIYISFHGNQIGDTVRILQLKKRSIGRSNGKMWNVSSSTAIKFYIKSLFDMKFSLILYQTPYSGVPFPLGWSQFTSVTTFHVTHNQFYYYSIIRIDQWQLGVCRWAIIGEQGRPSSDNQRPYIRRRCTPIHSLCNAYLGCTYPC